MEEQNNKENLEGKAREHLEITSNFKITDKNLFNLAGKLIGGFVLYELGKFVGGDYGAIAGAYIGLRCTYNLPWRNGEFNLSWRKNENGKK
ncbi:MAG: hypothetical protein PHH54_03295 [Candidatus Nanoarchaeia archaeon]|nr:hypothetical protein [Candidatus Nanoarchaeia archaeon]MDD5740982.1 hypothetical protein [Candidatus Nanoarchaeia archaeon]